MVSKTQKSSLTTRYGNTVSVAEAVDSVSVRLDPPKVRGVWRDMDDGYRFRLPTDYGRAELVQHNGAPSILMGRRTVNNFRHEVISSPGGYATGNFRSGNWIYRYDSALGLPSSLGPPSFPIMEENEAVTKSLNKIGDMKANIGENLATLGMTIRLLKDPIGGIISATKKVREDKTLWPLIYQSYRQLRRNGGIPSKVAQKYLEYVYGIAPLVSDVYGILELAKEQSKAPLLLNGRGSAERMLSGPDLAYFNASLYRDERWTSCVAKSKTRTTLWATISKQTPALRSLQQLGLLNPASLAWELVPYSFVLDWVLPIGPVLYAFSAPAGLDFVGGSTSRRLTAYWNYSITPRTEAGYVYERNDPATGTFQYNGYRRKVLTNWPRPGLWIDTDPFRLKGDGSDRIFKALALSLVRMPYL